MKKISLFIILLIVFTLALYLNRAYAYIYNEIGNGNLKYLEKNQTYIIGDNKNNKNLIYTALGDSLTIGAGVENAQQSYPYLVAEKLSKKNNIILNSRAELGFKTIDLGKAFVPLAIADKPNIITLFIGVNDIHNNISKEEFTKNYDTILKELTTQTTAKIYLINLPFIGSKNLILPPYNLYFDLKTKELNDVIKKLATKYNLTYINLYSPTKEEFIKSNSYYSTDLFHPSAKGYSFWADIIYNNLQ